MSTDYSHTAQTHNAGKGKKPDIVQQIRDFYNRSEPKHDIEQVKPLVPTKAALFGLDCRFKQVEERILNQKNSRKVQRSVS